MALQLWLPLNGSLRNVGLTTGYTITQNGGAAAYDTAIIGKGLVCNGSKNWKINGVTLTGKASFTWWSKTTVNGKMPWVLECVASNYLNFYESSIYTLNIGDGNNNPFQTPSNANINVLHDGKWHHFAVTFDSITAKLYIDGEYKGKALTFRSPLCTNKTLKLAGDFNGSHTYDWNGMIADFRVYDNCLIDQDVVELYQNNAYRFVPFWKHNSLMQFGDASHIGASIKQTAYNVVQSGSSMYFNGTSSYIEFDGLNLLSGGSVSMWVNLPAKPTAQKVMYCDPTSKMIVGFLAGGTILTSANGTNYASYQSTGMTWNAMNHIVAVYGANRHPIAFYVNGVQPATGTSSNWTNSGTKASIGRRLGSGTADYLQGCVNSVRVFTKSLTQTEVTKIYNDGIEVRDESVFRYMNYSGCTWLKVLHHNTPSSKLFTSSNGKRNDDKDLYSRLGLFDSNTNFRMPNNNYEFLVREKLESTHTESAATWIQTSSPTASTIAGFQLLTSSPGNPPRTFGLCHQSANAVFDISTQDWWCACGCNTAYQGGIPGFWGVIKSGYLDLYIRVDDTKYLGIADVPNDYTVLQYIEANGTQWIDTGLAGFNTTDWEIFCEWKLSAAPAGTYAYVFGVYENEDSNAYRVITNQKSTTDYYGNGNSKAGGGSISVTGKASASTHTVLLKGDGKFMLDGSNYTAGTFGTALPAGNTMGLFRTKKSDGTFTNFFKGRIYAFWAKKGGVFKCNLVPARRNSDSVVGMYDVTRKMFLTNTGTGTFTAGSVVTI